MPCCPRGDSFVNPKVKYALFFFNFESWLCGGVMSGVGIWAYIEKNKNYYQDIHSIYDVLFDPAILLIIVGAFIFVLGFAGYVGALRENLCLLRVFYIMIIVIFLVEVFTVLAFVFKDEMRDWVTDVLKDGMILRYQDDEDALMDWFQENIKCCGINGYKDWNKNIYFNCTKENPSGLKCGVPYSCCKDPDAFTPGMPNILCGGSALDETNTFEATAKIYTIGCVDALKNLGEANLLVIGCIVLGLGITQFLGICFGCRLVGQVKDQKERWRRSHR